MVDAFAMVAMTDATTLLPYLINTNASSGEVATYSTADISRTLFLPATALAKIDPSEDPTLNKSRKLRR